MIGRSLYAASNNSICGDLFSIVRKMGEILFSRIVSSMAGRLQLIASTMH